MKKVLSVPILAACTLIMSLLTSNTVFADTAASSQSGTVSESVTAHTYAKYYAQGYANALMGLHTYDTGDFSASFHIAHITDNYGDTLNFSFYGEKDFVENFGATKDAVLIAGTNDSYVVTAAPIVLSMDASSYDIDSFSSYLSTTQNFTGKKAKLISSKDGLVTTLLAQITDTYKGNDYKGYLCALTHNADRTGIRLTYLMPEASYNDNAARVFTDHLAFADKTWESALDDATSVADSYTSLPSLNVMCNTGYFNYRSLSSENFDAAQQLVKPSLIELFHAEAPDSGSGWSGSGIIYDIQPDYIYCLSVSHVLDLMSAENNELWLYDGTRLTFDNAISYQKLSDQNEICIFRIPTSMIPMRILVRIREITVNPLIYSSTPIGTQLLGISTNYKHTRSDLTTPMTLLKINDSIPEEPDAKVYLSATLALQEGMSGTAVVDLHGNLVGIADSRNLNTNKSYALMIDQLDGLTFTNE